MTLARFSTLGTQLSVADCFHHIFRLLLHSFRSSYVQVHVGPCDVGPLSYSRKLASLDSLKPYLHLNTNVYDPARFAPATTKGAICPDHTVFRCFHWRLRHGCAVHCWYVVSSARACLPSPCVMCLTLALAPARFRHAPSPRRGLLLGVAGGLSRSFCGGGLWGNLPHAPRPRIQGATPSNRYLEHTLARVRVRGVGARAFTCVVQPAGASVPTLALELLTADWALPCSGHHLFLHSVLFLAWQGGGGPIIVSIWGSEHGPRLRERALHPEAAHSTRAQGRCETRLSDDDVQYYLHERLKLEGKTGNRSRCATESIFWEPQRLGRVLRRQGGLRCSVKLT